jgi:acetyl esterase/lipase
MRKPIQIFFAAAFVCWSVGAQTTVWQPSQGHTQEPIWPKEPPDAQPTAGPEEMKTVKDPLISGGKPWIQIDNVSQPTMTVYSPKAKNTGAAVVVFPGGGYQVLAIDLQGTEICNWLTSKGITAVLLKYRVPTERVGPYRESPLALQDAQRAVGLVRFHAAEWHIDPHKIGVIGFSAGGHMVAAVSTHFEKRSYPAVDAADKESCRPDFAIALYPGHLSDSADDDNLALNPNVPVTSKTPSTFLLQAEDDPVDPVSNSLVYYIALKKAGVSVEMHLYAQGGHAFGLRPTNLPIARWPQLVETWLRTLKMVPN